MKEKYLCQDINLGPKVLFKKHVCVFIYIYIYLYLYQEITLCCKLTIENARQLNANDAS